MNSPLHQTMNSLIANFQVMYTKLHHFHWFVKGPHFFNLHEKFEELYNEVTEHVDDIAERILTLQEKPISTLKECLSLATIKEAIGIGKDLEMVEEVLQDFQTIDKQLLQGIKEASAEGDEGTVDLLLGISKKLEKHSWMLRAFLEK
ncbi:DNA starvation/stationary phase protection protein [Caldibacillus lycopersici]|uniref:DNA starvation/stationary phase protection protein n=1 Tax=Perspicuibacillus lycopersici TaxID=1325689 RepID=A0AAE3LNW4_9BACI|nr:Dps family protein [Perspicuibacillus lycopersici]MCU9614292.1 DNA starvation/stationary phase protection protein [Perspicuibacillus lycopersici]